MANNTRPLKAQRLGAALRKSRETKGLGLRELAGQLGIDAGQLSRTETGKTVPGEAYVARILTFLGVDPGEYADIVGLIPGAGDGAWLAVSLPEQRQQLAAILDLEDKAETIWVNAPLLIPGLLQISEYVRVIMAAGTVPAAEVATRVAVRIGRADVITRRHPVRLVAFIGEAALRQTVGTPAVMADQLRHLQSMAKRPNVDIRAIPLSSRWHPGLEGPFTLIDPRGDEGDDGAPAVVHLENRRSGLFLHEPDDVETYRQAVTAVRDVAMSPADTLRLIAELIEERTQ